MKALSRVLAVKIALTMLLWLIPLLLFPVSLLKGRLGFPDLGPPIFLRLLGMAYVALVVGYAFGWIAARAGRYPRQAVWAGIVSNGGAFLLLALGAWRHVWSSWGNGAAAVMWASLCATGLITAGLIAFGPCRRDASGREIG